VIFNVNFKTLSSLIKSAFVGVGTLYTYLYVFMTLGTNNFHNNINQLCLCNKEIVCSVNIMIFCIVTPCCWVGRFQ